MSGSKDGCDPVCDSQSGAAANKASETEVLHSAVTNLDCLSDQDAESGGPDCSSEGDSKVARPSLPQLDACLPRRASSSGTFAEKRPDAQWFSDLKLQSDDPPGLKKLKRKIKRRQQKLEQGVKAASMKLEATATAFNKGRLRRCDRVDAGPPTCRKWSGHWSHPKAWMAEATVELAFTSVGALSPNAPALRTTRRPLDAIAAVSLAATHQNLDACRMLTTSVVCGARSPFFFWLNAATIALLHVWSLETWGTWHEWHAFGIGTGSEQVGRCCRKWTLRPLPPLYQNTAPWSVWRRVCG